MIKHVYIVLIRMEAIDLSSHAIVVFCVTVFFFVIEAIVHYNIGKTGRVFGMELPSRTELGKIIIVVVFFAFLSTMASSLINSIFNM